MALSDLELSLMAFPQSWNAATQQLSVNLLMLPVGSPLAPLGTGPQFAGTTAYLKANFIAGVAALPSTSSTIALTLPYVATPPVGAVSLLQSLPGRLAPGTTISTAPPNALATTVRILKSLPDSYTQAFPFERPLSADIIFGDGYGCALAEQSPGQLYPTQQAPPPTTTTWGELIAYVLQQPQLAMAVGLVYPVVLNVPAATVANGGWLFFSLDTSVATHPWVADFSGNHDKVKSYAARIPALAAATSRQLFAATLFPIIATPGSEFTDAQTDAETYDDGFAQIVHCNQPTTVDAATGDTTRISPGAEAGLQIGWDDEKVTVWLNNSLDLMRLRQNASLSNPPAEAPLGVLGYRVDVQEVGGTSWSSLCNVSGNLPFSGATSNGSGTTPSGELWVAPAPVRPVPTNWTDPNANEAWLPLYFSQWRGTSLVVHDNTISQISPGTVALPPSALAANLTGVPQLRYGQQYNFRVRFADLTGGGPNVSAQPLHPGLAPMATTYFKRYIPPKSLEVATMPPPLPTAITVQGGTQTVAYPTQPAERTITSLQVNRPHIGYPEALFAGVDPSTFMGSSLTNLLAQAQDSGRALQVYDPDVDRFQVIVEARIPAHDIGTVGAIPGDLDGNYRILYSVTEKFPTAANGSVTLALSYVDTADISTITAPSPNATTLVIPTGRDVRIRLQPLCADHGSDYYGTSPAPLGLISDYIVRKEASAEASLFPVVPQSQLNGFYFQPGSNLLQLLAQNILWPSVGADGLPLTLQAQGLTLSAPVGKRVAFGASGAVRCSISPDGGAFTFTNQAELLDHWLVAFILDIERDWTWDGFAHNALTFSCNSQQIGTLSLPRTIPAAAVGEANPDRSTTRLIFFDAQKPDPATGSFPAPLTPQYSIVGTFTSAPTQTWNYDTLILPITTNPTQTPKIVATGIAESPYVPGPDYASSNLRDRFLWIEFDQPLADPEDAYFGRVLAYGPDPLLAASLLPPTQLPLPVEPALSIDPETIRVITAGQSSDQSGLQAMALMTPASTINGKADNVHFLLPLPPGISAEALDLFGFWTYEFRVGHANLWSTAQGRYGRPLRVTGVQHPAPHLICVPNRDKAALTVSAPYATTVYNGVRVYDIERGDPQTELWFMLYAQVMRADGEVWRNVLLSREVGVLMPPSAPILLQSTPVLNSKLLIDPSTLSSSTAAPLTSTTLNHSVNREPRGSTIFSQAAIAAALTQLGLPLTSALSVLAVEILPGPLNTRRIDVAGAPPASAMGDDPLGIGLGTRRILRTSPLTPSPPIC